MIPQIDLQIGITVYSTNFGGVGGKIKLKPEDFEVFEVINEKISKLISESNGYAVYKLKKKNIDTNHALSDILKKKGLRLKALGLKDASAITEQYVCSSKKEVSIDNFSSNKYSLRKIGFIKKPLSKKDMIGNHFKIKIIDCKNNLSVFNEQNQILNFFGYQRFGSKRPVTHLVGKAILQKNFKKAVDLILSFRTPFDSDPNNAIREKLADKSNYKKYFEKIPSQMDIERLVLREMIQSDDSLKSIKQIPLPLRRFFIQSYQSYLFNKSLSLAFSNGENLFECQDGDVCFDTKGIIGKFTKNYDQKLAMPFVGYAYYKKTRFDYYISRILENEEISPKDFFIKEMQEVSNEGGFRQVSISCTNYSCQNSILEFTLSRGSYATILLREIMKPENPLKVGF